MNSQCPECGGELKPKDRYCPHCGQAREPGQEPPQPPPDHGPDPNDERYTPGSPPAWESDGPWLARLGKTTWQVLSQPASTLAAPPKPSFSASLTYGMLMGFLGVCADTLWGLLISAEPHPWGPNAPYWLILSAPLVSGVSIFVFSGLLHLALKVAGGAKRVYFATFRVVAYSNAACIFYLLPVVGLLVVLFASLAVVVNGLAASHGVGRWRVLSSLIMVVVILGLAGILFGILFIDPPPAEMPA